MVAIASAICSLIKHTSSPILVYSFLSISGLPGTSATKIPLDNFNEVVRDLIKNWESPIVYLRQLGYLPKDYEDTSKIKPNLDALMNRMARAEGGRHLLGSDEDKPKQVALGAQKKKKREHVLQPLVSQDIKYPSVDQLLAMKQPSLAVAMSAAKLEEMLPKQKPIANPDSSSAQLKLYSQLLAKQQSNQVPQMAQSPDEYLQQLVVKTCPQTVDGTKLVGSSVLVQSLKNSPLSKTPDTNALSIVKNETTSDIQVEAPHYLSWDVANNKLHQISPNQKNTYVEKLLQIFLKKQETQENSQS